MEHSRTDRRLRAGRRGRHQFLRFAFVREPHARRLAGRILRGVPVRRRVRRVRPGAGVRRHRTRGDSGHRGAGDARGGARQPRRAGARGAGARTHRLHLPGRRRGAQRPAPSPGPHARAGEPGRGARLGGVRDRQRPEARRFDPRRDPRPLQGAARGRRGHLARSSSTRWDRANSCPTTVATACCGWTARDWRRPTTWRAPSTTSPRASRRAPRTRRCSRNSTGSSRATGAWVPTTARTSSRTGSFPTRSRRTARWPASRRRYSSWSARFSSIPCSPAWCSCSARRWGS